MRPVGDAWDASAARGDAFHWGGTGPPGRPDARTAVRFRALEAQWFSGLGQDVESLL